MNWYKDRLPRQVIAPSFDDYQYTIPDEYHCRPDLISFAVYGSTNYIDRLVWRNLNVINNPLADFKAGVVIVIPPIGR